MYLIKKLYNLYRNLRSKYSVAIYKLIYGNAFMVQKDLYVQKDFLVTIEEKGKIKIGQRVFFNNGCSLNSLCGISIEDDCIFGENVKIYDHNHIYTSGNVPINEQGFTMDQVVVGRNTWVASNVTILKGIHIGARCVIGANCVVYKDVPDDTLVTSENKLTIRKIVGR